jgi:DNA-binding NtrC family response regulator
VDVPPLSKRWQDVAAYLESTLAPGTSHSVWDVLSPAARAVLRSHAWDGNFRELTSFRQRIPRNAAIASVDAATCRAVLERGSLNAIVEPADEHEAALEQPNWAELASRATSAFLEDRARQPVSWDDQKEWNEKYLKPLLFAYLSGAVADETPSDDEALASLAARSASRLHADRGTAIKQLRRFYERFGS